MAKKKLSAPALEDWYFLIALPAVKLKDPVEVGSAAVVPASDPRYKRLVESDPGIKEYLACFRTAFGQALSPAIIICDKRVPAPNSQDLADFRNILALAAVTQSRTDRCNHHYGGDGPAYADLFEFHPVNLRKSGKGLIVESGTEFGSSLGIANFAGQPHPAYVFPNNVTPKFDVTLLNSLLSLWRAKPSTIAGRQYRSRVFRALELAYHALASPFRHLGSDAERALPLALWVSSFEILAHPGHQDVHFKDVEALIVKAKWYSRQAKAKRFASVEHRRPPKAGKPPLPPLPRTSRPVQVYQRLYRVRNQSLHGGAVAPSLIKSKRWNHLYAQVPGLFRGVLLSVLATGGFHTYPKEPPGGDVVEALEFAFRVDRHYREYEMPLYERCKH